MLIKWPSEEEGGFPGTLLPRQMLLVLVLVLVAFGYWEELSSLIIHCIWRAFHNLSLSATLPLSAQGENSLLASKGQQPHLGTWQPNSERSTLGTTSALDKVPLVPSKLGQSIPTQKQKANFLFYLHLIFPAREDHISFNMTVILFA